MKNIHVLPTDKPSRLCIDNSCNELNYSQIEGLSSKHITNQHIYITSDEEIKEGDWYLDTTINVVFKNDKIFLNGVGYKKIILTTDQDLIKEGVQKIDDEFLEWFVKNPSCEEVEVEIESKFDRVDGHYHDVWEIIIPKEEPNGCIGSNGISDPKLNEVQLNQPKQETLEEAVERIVKSKVGLHYFGNENSLENLAKKEYIIEGAKWQQERSYNDEDLRIAFVEGHNSARLRGSYKFNGTFEEDWILWFEKFKKK